MAVETLPYLEAVKRMLRAAGRRVGAEDEFELAEMLTLRAELEDAITAAIAGQMHGPQQRSWAGIADALGTTRQAAFKRYAHKIERRATEPEPVYEDEEAALAELDRAERVERRAMADYR